MDGLLKIPEKSITSLVQVQQTAQMVGYFFTNMNTSTGRVQVFQTCMSVSASLTDMTAG